MGRELLAGLAMRVFDCGDLEQGRHNPKRDNAYFAKKQQEYRNRQKEKKITEGNAGASLFLCLRASGGTHKKASFGGRGGKDSNSHASSSRRRRADHLEVRRCELLR